MTLPLAHPAGHESVGATGNAGLQTGTAAQRAAHGGTPATDMALRRTASAGPIVGMAPPGRERRSSDRHRPPEADENVHFRSNWAA